MNQSHRVRGPRADTALVVVRQELGLVRSHVHVHGAFAFAAFAREAQVERLFHMFVAPAAGERIALQHLEQHPCAAACRVLLLARDTIAGAHRAALLSPALADADTPRRREREAAAIVGILKVRRERRRPVRRAEPEILIDPVRTHDLAGIHLSVRIPDGLELAERLDELGPEHLREKLRARLAVAMLAREGAAVGQHEVGRLVHERLVRFYSRCCLEIEIDARMDAPLSEVAVQRAAVAIFLEQLPQRPEI